MLLSGPREATGISQKAGVELLKEEINSEGGLLAAEHGIGSSLSTRTTKQIWNLRLRDP